MNGELPLNWEMPKGRKSMIFRTCWKCHGHGGGLVGKYGDLAGCGECHGLGGWPVPVEKATEGEEAFLVGRLAIY